MWKTEECQFASTASLYITRWPLWNGKERNGWPVLHWHFFSASFLFFFGKCSVVYASSLVSLLIDRFFFDSACFSLPRTFFIESQISVFCGFFLSASFFFVFWCTRKWWTSCQSSHRLFFCPSIIKRSFFFFSLFASYFLCCFSVSRLYSNSQRASIGLVAGFYVCSFWPRLWPVRIEK